MKKQRKKYRVDKPAGGYDHVSSSAEFYSSSPAERPLADDKAPSDSHAVSRTGRHQALNGRGPQTMDPREKMALIAILKLVVLIMALMFAFFLLRMGIKLYEDSIWIETVDTTASPLLEEAELVEDFDIADQEARQQFAARVELWKEAERLVSSADLLLHRKIYDQAIKQCQDALRHDPAHLGALERLGRLYYAQGSYVEAVNAYIRLLSVDPSRKETQKSLIEALAAFEDYAAVRYMAEWYLDDNTFDAEVELYLAHSLFALEDYAASAEAYERALRKQTDDYASMEQLVAAYFQLGEYEKALVPLEKMRTRNFKNPVYVRQIAICHAQLEQPQETVQTLVRATQGFGKQMVLGMIQDPMLDPVRQERVFQAFVDRIGGEDFRLGIEEMAQRAAEKRKGKPAVEPMLGLPVEEQ